MYRLPVRYKGKPLMPMKPKRVKEFVTLGKAKIRYDRKMKMHYLQLLEEPSGFDTQEIVLGIDPGSTFDGFSIVSNDTHHVNIELIQRSKKGKDSISSYKKRQSGTRRTRRLRLRHRPIRFDRRTKNKLSPTIRANVEFRQWLIIKLMEMYPITKVVIEDVKFNHYKSKKGKSFSHVEQGKTALYDWIKEQGLKLELYNGWNTKKLRINTFGGDPKVADKGSRSFEAHCVDSFVLACRKEHLVDEETGEILDEPIALNQLIVRKAVTFIKKIVKVRRRFFLTRKRFGKKGKEYYRQGKGGIKVPYVNISSHRALCRVKPNGEHSNHPKQWNLLDNGFAERFKYFTQGYGRTVIKGQHKFFINNQWSNRIITT